jgi:hypothetical protein
MGSKPLGLVIEADPAFGLFLGRNPDIAERAFNSLFHGRLYFRYLTADFPGRKAR